MFYSLYDHYDFCGNQVAQAFVLSALVISTNMSLQVSTNDS